MHMRGLFIMAELWEDLFKLAIRYLENNNIPNHAWSFGGGTSLRLLYNHRESEDIDIFFTDRQFLSFFSPSINDFCLDSVKDYSVSENAIKLKFEKGDIDFIAAKRVTDYPVKKETTWLKNSRTIPGTKYLLFH